jgi:hypothetical protein
VLDEYPHILTLLILMIEILLTLMPNTVPLPEQGKVIFTAVRQAPLQSRSITVLIEIELRVGAPVITSTVIPLLKALEAMNLYLRHSITLQVLLPLFNPTRQSYLRVVFRRHLMPRNPLSPLLLIQTIP